MSVLLQLLIFGFTGWFLYYGVFYGTPKLIAKGIPLIYAFWFFLWLPVLLLLPTAILLYFLEGNTWEIGEFLTRFSLNELSGSDWLWVAGAIVLTIIFDQLLEPLGKFFAKYSILSPLTFPHRLTP